MTIATIKLVLFVFLAEKIFVFGHHINPNIEDDRVKRLNWLVIYPGTKWCGHGNISEHENDLGKFNETDRCCQNHDNCEDYMSGFETKYNLTNPTFHSRLTCECDKNFNQCLKSVNDFVSKQIGFVYFNTLHTKCFKKEYPIVLCKKRAYGTYIRCVEYEFDTSKDKIYQFFDVPTF